MNEYMLSYDFDKGYKKSVPLFYAGKINIIHTIYIQTIVLIFVITTFQPLYPSAIIRYTSIQVTYKELQTEPFI